MHCLNDFLADFSDYRKADSECDDGSSLSQKKRNSATYSLWNCVNETGASAATTTNAISTAKFSKQSERAKPEGVVGRGAGGVNRRKNQSRLKLSGSPPGTDDDDTDNVSGRVDKGGKNNRRKRMHKEKVQTNNPNY